MYPNKLLEACWINPETDQPMGFVHVGSVTPASIAYITKYVILIKDPLEGISDTFQLQSIKPPIGGEVVGDRRKWHKNGLFNYAVKPGGEKVPLSRSVKDKIFNINEKEFIRLKNEAWRKVKNQQVDQDKPDFAGELAKIEYITETVKNRIKKLQKL